MVVIKQRGYLRYVYKLHTARLRKAKWNLTLDVKQAQQTGEVISLAESQTIRFIEEIDGIDREAASKKLTDCKAELKDARKNPRSRALLERVSEIYREMHELQFCPEYLCLVCDSEKDYRRACEGFFVNGMEYRRLLGTSGGVKQSTIVFVSTHTRHGVPLIDALRHKINNGRDMSMTYIPAKLEAYMALTCSSSTPVEWPKGVAVVKDCMTKFRDDYVLLEDSPDGGEPVATDIIGGELEMDASDGYGLMSPVLAARWSRELDLPYTAAGFCVRNAFCKGMVYAFDFERFAEEVAGSYIIEDVWGNQVDVRNVELILTESMLKLWDAYKSIEDYTAACVENGYEFSITKATPERLDTVRRLNYQFIQSYHLTDEDIWELIEPTVTELSDAMGGDVNRALLFLRGKDVTSHTARLDPYDFVSALMIADEMIYDPYVCSRIKQLINKRVNEAKFGKIYVHGNYSIISGDPYALCQNMFGLPVTGLLSYGEVYNAYWREKGVPEAVCFRAPMSSHRNIRRVKICQSDKAADWYQHMPTVTIFNAFDTMCMALNGADKILSPASETAQ